MFLLFILKNESRSLYYNISPTNFWSAKKLKLRFLYSHKSNWFSQKEINKFYDKASLKEIKNGFHHEIKNPEQITSKTWRLRSMSIALKNSFKNFLSSSSYFNLLLILIYSDLESFNEIYNADLGAVFYINCI